MKEINFEALKEEMKRNDTDMYIFVESNEVICTATSIEALYGKMYHYLIEILGLDGDYFTDEEFANYFPVEEIVDEVNTNGYWEDDFAHCEDEEPQYVIATMPKRVFDAIRDMNNDE